MFRCLVHATSMLDKYNRFGQCNVHSVGAFHDDDAWILAEFVIENAVSRYRPSKRAWPRS